MAKYFNRFIFICFIISCFVSIISSQDIKTNYHQRHSSLELIPTDEIGYCIRKVPYNPRYPHANRTRNLYDNGNSSPDININRQNWNDTTRAYLIPVIDCCNNYHRDPYTNRCERNDTHSTSIESSQCQDNCFGGECINGVCNCPPGWYESEGSCKPMCRRPCQQNAYCFSPDVCECKLGYEQTSDRECRPICPGGCSDGECVAPRVCQCRPGYILNDARTGCVAVCEGGCTHGQCVMPGVCSCDPGYINSPRDRESCVPDCGPNNCDGGQCVSPNVCRCRSGYTQDSLSNRCIPECRNGCPINARCRAPDRCVCNPGFEMDHYNNRCILSSDYNNNNNNNDNNSNNDYNNNGSSGHQEQGHCERQCINGICMGYNICSCNDGYVQDPRDPTRTRCIASCPGGCINGVCSAPNFCICNPGYIKDRATKGSQRCVPRYNY